MCMNKLATAVSAKDHVAGPADAPVALVEYGDYQCPGCGGAEPVVKKLRKHFGDKLRFVFRNFPLPMHEFAEHAAEAAEFAAAKGKFWEMHDALYKHQRELSDPTLSKIVESIGLSAEELTAALGKHTYAAHVKADMASGEKSGVTGTPMFFINGERYEDASDYATLEAAIARHIP